MMRDAAFIRQVLSRCAWIIILASALALASCSATSSHLKIDFSPFDGEDLDGSVLSAPSRTPPDLDGEIDYEEWCDASAYITVIPLRDGSLGQVRRLAPALVLASNDGRNFYLGLLIADETFDRNAEGEKNGLLVDTVQIAFDSDRSGDFSDLDDVRIAGAYGGNVYADSHLMGGEILSDENFSGYCLMRYREDKARYEVECAIPLDSGDASDVQTLPGDRIAFNVRYFDGLGSKRRMRVGMLWGPMEDLGIREWIELELAEIVTPVEAEPSWTMGTVTLIRFDPDGNTDLLVLDEADPAPRSVPLPFEIIPEGPSLSPDGSRVAFSGVDTQPGDFSRYEIYAADVQTGEVTQLTDNGIVDAHPAWSPDGEQIAFVRFVAEQDGMGQLFLMNADGTGQRRLTFSGVDDNDPEWSPDGGRIVFKTRRYNGREQIALLELDTGEVRRVTDNPFSDHDPVFTPDGQWILFERFEGEGSWDRTQTFFPHPWSIRAVRPDGSRERLLASDGLINWLPVASPDGGFVLYLCNLSSGYTRLKLLDPATGETWDLLDEYTNLGYLDWK